MKTYKTILVVAALALAANAGCKKKSDKKDDGAKVTEGTGTGKASGTDTGSGAVESQTAKKDDGTGLAGDGKAVETAQAGGKMDAVLEAAKTEQAEQAALTMAQPAVAKNAKLMAGTDVADGGDLKLVMNDNGDTSEIRLETKEVLEKVIGLINGAVKFPKDIPVVMDKCGEPNAYYSSQDQAIKFCDEWSPFADMVFSRYKTDPAEIKALVVDTVIETFIHELGHCLIDQWKLPATGREEDAADQLAAFVLIDESDDSTGIIMGAAEFWLGLAVTRGESGRNDFADEHSLDQVRFYNFACLVFGSNPDKYGSLIEDYDLPLKRAVRCPDEYRNMRAAWGGLLEKILIQG